MQMHDTSKKGAFEYHFLDMKFVCLHRKLIVKYHNLQIVHISKPFFVYIFDAGPKDLFFLELINT